MLGNALAAEYAHYFCLGAFSFFKSDLTYNPNHEENQIWHLSPPAKNDLFQSVVIFIRGLTKFFHGLLRASRGETRYNNANVDKKDIDYYTKICPTPIVACSNVRIASIVTKDDLMLINIVRSMLAKYSAVSSAILMYDFL